MKKIKLEDRVDDVILAERLRSLTGNGPWGTYAFPSCDLECVIMHDGPTGLRITLDDSNPDPTSVPATCYPTSSALANTWNPQLISELGHIFGQEMQAFNTNLILGPGINIKRDPRGGRNFEYWSEDPLLTGVLASSFVSSLQEEGVGACVKHYLLNNQETYRVSSSSEVDERAFHELYLRPFEMVIKNANPWAIMCSYNAYDGIYVSENPYILKTILRGELKYEGVVMSDWGAVSDCVKAHAAGLDLEMPGSADRTHSLFRALKRGDLKMEQVVESSDRLTKMSEKAKSGSKNKKDFSFLASHQIAKKAAAESIVLAKNEENVLPLSNYEKTVFIGAIMEEFPIEGNGSSHVVPKNKTSFKELVTSSNGVCNYAPGYRLDDKEDKELFKDALDLAASAAHIVYFIGLPESEFSEGYDRQNIDLPKNQLDLLGALYALNPHIILVVMSGGPLVIPAEKAEAVLLTYFSGEATAEALNDILLGQLNPSGHLSETWPLALEDVPSFSSFAKDQRVVSYKEGLFVGYRYYTSVSRPVLYPFGHGLSYTTFAIKNPSSSLDGENIKLKFSLENTGERAGMAVVQIYCGPKSLSRVSPLCELIFFLKVELDSHEEREISVLIPSERFSFYDSEQKKFVIEKGLHELYLGFSSIDLPIKLEVELDGEIVKENSLSKHFLKVLNDNNFECSDEEFLSLIEKNAHLEEIKHKGRPFTIDSPFRDFIGTFIGNICYKKLLKMFEKNPRQLKMVLDMPIRMMGAGGINPKWAPFIVAFSNHEFFKALKLLIKRN